MRGSALKMVHSVPGKGTGWLWSGTASRGAGIQGPHLSHSHRLKGQIYGQGSEATEGVAVLKECLCQILLQAPFCKASGSPQPRSTWHGLCRPSHNREFRFSDVDASCSWSLDGLPRSPTTYWQARGPRTPPPREGQSHQNESLTL